MSVAAHVLLWGTTTPSNLPRELTRNVIAIVAWIERLLVTGSSDVGKNSLICVICGVWDSREGFAERSPAKQTIFFPQRLFVMLGTLQ